MPAAKAPKALMTGHKNENQPARRGDPARDPRDVSENESKGKGLP